MRCREVGRLMGTMERGPSECIAVCRQNAHQKRDLLLVLTEAVLGVDG